MTFLSASQWTIFCPYGWQYILLRVNQGAKAINGRSLNFTKNDKQWSNCKWISYETVFLWVICILLSSNSILCKCVKSNLASRSKNHEETLEYIWLWFSSVGRAIASGSRGSWFKYSHRKNLYWTLTVNCIEKTEIKKKESGNRPFLKLLNICSKRRFRWWGHRVAQKSLQKVSKYLDSF